MIKKKKKKKKKKKSHFTDNARSVQSLLELRLKVRRIPRFPIIPKRSDEYQDSQSSPSTPFGVDNINFLANSGIFYFFLRRTTYSEATKGQVICNTRVNNVLPQRTLGRCTTNFSRDVPINLV